MMRLKSYAVKSHPGPFLSLNEDAAFYRPKSKIALLVDALGGQGVTDKILEEFCEHLLGLYEKWSDDPEMTLPFNFNDRYLIETNVLMNALSSAHHWLLEKNENVALDKRCGASVLLIAESDSLLNIVSVGNLSCYLVRRGKMIKTLKEDSMELVSKDSVSRQFRCHPQHVLGMYRDYLYQIKEVKILPGDRHFFCSDGIYSRLTKEEIFHILQNEDRTPSQMLLECMNLSNLRGNLDNQGGIILNY